MLRRGVGRQDGVMKLSTRIRYGTRALLELAQTEETLSVTAMAERQSLSVKYLEQIMRNLRKAGLVVSTAGVRGGYRLARPADRITMDEVYLAFEGSFALVECVETPSRCRKSGACKSKDLWGALSDSLRQTLRASTLADLLSPSPPSECRIS